MKIAVISTTVFPVPLAGYGGLEQVAYLCAAGLSRRGHQVLLVAPNNSTAPPGVELHGTTQGESEQQAFSGYHQRLAGYDAIIDHSWQKWSYMLKVHGQLAAPVLGVCHAPIHTMFQPMSPPPLVLPCLVALSNDQSAACMEHLGVPARTCYNAVDASFYARKDVPRTDRYLFLARMSTIKGPAIAVDLARRLRFKLDLVGDDALTAEPQLAQRMRALAVNNIAYHGGVSRERSVDFYSAAKGMLHPAFPFREPFGLAPVEAQAAGLGVLASDHGALRETVKHGETGFLCKTPEDMAEYIKTDAIASIKPEACVENARRFSIAAMVQRYEALCQEAIEVGW